MIIIVDFGSQYTALIARRVRELNVYCEVVQWNAPLTAWATKRCSGYILSGSPASVHDVDGPSLPAHVLASRLPILGICYGMQCFAIALGGQVSTSQRREYGLAKLEVVGNSPLFENLPSTLDVWMSHGDHVERLPPNFVALARTASTSIAAMGDYDGRIFGVLFHPEVAHTALGSALLRNFAYNICGCHESWNPISMITKSVSTIQAQIGKERALCAVSGGVDSTVTAVLAQKAIDDRLTCVFVDHGLLRQNEAKDVILSLRTVLKTPVVKIDATDRFLSALRGVTDPEQKRRIIGELFIRVFESEADKHSIPFLIQGTLYSDVIESASLKGSVASMSSARIKSHHNVGGLPSDMKLKLVEPLRKLFKDEVRQLGRALSLPDEILQRHPFPGPGLAIRCLGEITRKRLEVLRSADYILTQELRAVGLDRETALAFAVLLPVRSVGVMGDSRSYGQVVALRVVTSNDLMTADWKRLPHETLAHISTRIVNEVPDVNRVVYDITSKPPATIDWE